MISLLLSPLRSGSAVCLILGLAACTEVALPTASFAGQPPVPACQQSPSASPTAEARTRAGTPSTVLLLAQALPSQPVGVDPGEPACTYDPIVPSKPKIIRGLW